MLGIGFGVEITMEQRDQMFVETLKGIDNTNRFYDTAVDYLQKYDLIDELPYDLWMDDLGRRIDEGDLSAVVEAINYARNKKRMRAC
jgi:hypothetical protein